MGNEVFFHDGKVDLITIDILFYLINGPDLRSVTSWQLFDICYDLIFATRVIPILSFYGIQNQIGSHIIFHIKGQVQISHLSNL